MTIGLPRIASSLAVDTITTCHLVRDARRSVAALHSLRDDVCPAWVDDAALAWLDAVCGSADAAWTLLEAAVRNGDAVGFIARLEVLLCVRLLLEDPPGELRAEAHLQRRALDGVEVALRVLRQDLGIAGKHPNPPAASRLRRVLAGVADNLDDPSEAGPAVDQRSSPGAEPVITPPSRRDRPTTEPVIREVAGTRPDRSDLDRPDQPDDEEWEWPADTARIPDRVPLERAS